MKKQINSIGIDMAKHKFDACFVMNNEVIHKQTFENNVKGINEYLEKLRILNVKKEIPTVVESTGDFHILFCLTLSPDRLVSLINPLITKQYSRAKIRKQKSDIVDAQILARIGLNEELKEFNTSKEIILKKKKLLLIANLEKRIQSMTLALKNFEELYKILGTDPGEVIRSIKSSIEELKNQIKKLEKEIEEETENCKKLSKIEGISKRTASKILLFIEGKDFKSKGQLCAYAGMDISTKLSGESIHKRGQISKRGNPYLRKILFQGAWGLVMHNEAFKKLYNYHRGRGKHYFTCILIIARKLLNVIYGMLKSGSDFNPKMITVPA